LRNAAALIYINPCRGGGTRSARFDKRFAKTTQTEKAKRIKEEIAMAWTTPTLVEICIGLEINGYLPAEI
jgi:coenzyme PQQ precursor peptide PqqA